MFLTSHVSLRRVAACAAFAAIAGLGLAGCGVGEAIKDQVGAAACSAIKPAVDQAKTQVNDAIRSVSVDPSSALSKLEAARSVLQGVKDGLTDRAGIGDLQPALDTLDKLIPLVEAQANGETRDLTAIEELETQLSDQIATLGGVC